MFDLWFQVFLQSNEHPPLVPCFFFLNSTNVVLLEIIIPVQNQRKYWHHAFIASAPTSSVKPREEDDPSLKKRPDQVLASPTLDSHRNHTGSAASTRNPLTLLVQSRHPSRLIATFKDKNITVVPPGSKNWSVSTDSNRNQFPTNRPTFLMKLEAESERSRLPEIQFTFVKRPRLDSQKNQLSISLMSYD